MNTFQSSTVILAWSLSSASSSRPVRVYGSCFLYSFIRRLSGSDAIVLAPALAGSSKRFVVEMFSLDIIISHSCGASTIAGIVYHGADFGIHGQYRKDGKRRSDHPSVTMAIAYELPVCIAIQVKISNITE